MTSHFYGTGLALPDRPAVRVSAWRCGRCGADHFDSSAFCSHCHYPSEQYETGFYSGKASESGKTEAAHFVLRSRAKALHDAREAYMAEIRNPAFDITYATKLRRDLDLAIDALCALVEP